MALIACPACAYCGCCSRALRSPALKSPARSAIVGAAATLGVSSSECISLESTPESPQWSLRPHAVTTVDRFHLVELESTTFARLLAALVTQVRARVDGEEVETRRAPRRASPSPAAASLAHRPQAQT